MYGKATKEEMDKARELFEAGERFYWMDRFGGDENSQVWKEEMERDGDEFDDIGPDDLTKYVGMARHLLTSTNGCGIKRL